MIKYRNISKWCAAVLLLYVCILLGGCYSRTADSDETMEGQSSRAESSIDLSEVSISEEETASREKTDGAAEDGSQAWTTGSTEVLEAPREPGVQQKIVVATDLHYLAERLSGNRCESFMSVVEAGDGRVLQYSWEILDAFIDDMLREKPDLIVLSGDLTFNGEKESHEELAQKLLALSDSGIEVAVIPGNHDINNPEAKRFTSDGAVKTESVTAEEFASIYADFGYVAADDRDPASLSYLYKLDDYYWLLMLDSCQYEPANQIGGMIRPDTYDWIEKHLEDAWDKGAQVITVSHHNLLDQSGVSREFYDNCTIEHNEELLQTLYDGHVRLHLSGHLHLQHYMQDSDWEIYEIVTGSLVMSPCHYGVLKIMDSGVYAYEAKEVDVNGWAAKKGYKNKDLADFKGFCEAFLTKAAYKNAIADLRKYTAERKLLLSDSRIDKMARFYAKLCVYYYEGRMYEILDEVKDEKEFGYWNSVGYVSELSDFLRNILNDEAKDFSHLEIPY